MVDLANQEIFTEIKNQAEDAILSADGRAAFVFVRNLPVLLAEEGNQGLVSQPDLLAAYNGLADRLSFVALPSLRENEAVDLFKTKLSVGLRENNIKLVEKINAHLLTIPAFTARDDLRRKLREAMLANEEKLGAGQIIVAATKVSPTIGNWLKKYNERFGMEMVDQVERNQFLVTDPEIASLPEEEKMSLRRLIEVYEYLKLSSNTPEGLEDSVLFNIAGKRKVLRQGQWEDLVLPSQIEAIINETFKIYQSGAAGTAAAMPAVLQLSSLTAAARTLLQESKGDGQAIRNALFTALESKDITRALTALLLLAQLRQLDDVLTREERFLALVRSDLKASGQDDKVEGLRLNPTAPNFLARFLKVVLQGKLSLDERSALDFARKLTGLLALEGEKYSRIVVEDGRGGWKWNL